MATVWRLRFIRTVPAAFSLTDIQYYIRRLLRRLIVCRALAWHRYPLLQQGQAPAGIVPPHPRTPPIERWSIFCKVQASTECQRCRIRFCSIFSLFFFLHFFQSKKPRLCGVKGLRETELHPKRPWPCSLPIKMKRFLSRDFYFFSQSIWEFWKPTTRNQRSYHVLFSKDIRSALVCAFWASWRWWCWCHQVHFPAHLTLPSTPTESRCQYHFSFECLHLLKL